MKLRKISKVSSTTVRTLDCHCGCSGKPGSAVMKGYVGSWF